MNIYKPIIIFLIIFTCGAVLAQIYHWNDPDSGEAHFANPPPAGQKAQEFDALPDVVTPSKNITPPKTAEAEPNVRNKLLEELNERCQEARNNLKMLKSDKPVGTVLPDGTKQKMDKTARAAALKQAKEAIKNYCE